MDEPFSPFLSCWQPFVKHTTSIACYESQDCKTLLLTSITCQLVDMSTLFLHCSSVWHSNEKPRITFWGGNRGQAKNNCIIYFGNWGPILTNVLRLRKNVHHHFQKNMHHFFKNVQHFFSEVRITNFTNRPRFRKTFNQTNPT